MNDLDEFAEIASAMFVSLTLLIWLLTYLERTLLDPASERRSRRKARAPQIEASPASPAVSRRTG